MDHHKKSFFDYINYILFIGVIFVTLYPFWYVLMYSLSDPNANPLNHYYFIPNGFSLISYNQVFKSTQVLIGFKNSLFVTGVGTVLTLLFTAATAFPLSREHMTGRKFLFGMILFTMLFNGGMIPTFIVVQKVRLFDSLWALIIPGLISVYNMLIMVKFFKQFPIGLIESAKIDGYNDVSIFFRIVIPLSKAVFAAIGLFYAVTLWNTYFSAILYVRDPKKDVIQVVVRAMVQDDQLGADTGLLGIHTTPETMRMAVIIFSLIPILLVYPFLQKHFMKGVTLGSVKG